MVAGDDDVILEPDSGNQWRTGRVLLQPCIIFTQMEYEIPGGNLIDCPRSIFPKAVRLRLSPVEVLVHVTTGVIIDLDFEARNHSAPRWISGDFVRVRS